jgi:hypothetical protein
MRWDRGDLSPAVPKAGPLLASGPWLRDVLMLNPQSRGCGADRAGAGRRHAYSRTGLCDDQDAAPGVHHNRSPRPRRAASVRSARPAQPDHRSNCRRAPTPSLPSALVNLVGGPGAFGVFSESGRERADCRRGSWIRKPERRLHPAQKPIDVGINSEASVIIFHDGWYYLLVTDGACCVGATSSCDIRIGRSRKVTGPFVDSMGMEMLPDQGMLVRPTGRPAHRPRSLRSARSRRRARGLTLKPFRL